MGLGWGGDCTYTELEFLKRLWGLGTEEEEGYRNGPPGYIGWRNSFLGIDSGAPYTFKNTSTGMLVLQKGGRYTIQKNFILLYTSLKVYSRFKITKYCIFIQAYVAQHKAGRSHNTTLKYVVLSLFIFPFVCIIRSFVFV
jgi:hypothetical protein